MGNNEEGKSSKSDKSTSPAPPDQSNIHVYPDWVAMQAYYGHGVALPPYYNSAVAPGHSSHGPPPYVWGPPQHMMSPYGTPYAAFYSHGGLYAHPAVPLGSSPGQGVALSPAIAPSMSTETPTKSTGNSDQGLVQKLKRCDGLAMSIGNATAESPERGGEHRLSNCTETTEDSSDGSNGNRDVAGQSGRKRSREETPTTVMGAVGKTETRASSAEETCGAPSKVLAESVCPTSVPGIPVGSIVSPGMTTTLELRNPPIVTAKTSSPNFPQSGSVLPPQTWLQNERELKQERRKQSNRESARRSRLRKQAETGELAKKVDSLAAENDALRSEINRLTENTGKLRAENSAFMEKLKYARAGKNEELALNKTVNKKVQPISTENLLSKINNSGSIERSSEENGNRYEKNSGVKLHQLLDANPRADVVAAR